MGTLVGQNTALVEVVGTLLGLCWDFVGAFVDMKVPLRVLLHGSR